MENRRIEYRSGVDGGYILAGGASMGGSIGGDFYVVKLNASPSNIQENSQVSSVFELSQNYPNPFNPATLISWQLAVGSEVELKVFNLLGQEVQTLVNEEQPAGFHSIFWNAEGVASGIYFYTIQAENYRAVKKKVLMK